VVSATLLTALCLQALAVALMRHRLGPGWLRRPMTLVVLAAILYQGVSQILLAIPAIRVWDYYRVGIAQRYIDSATLIMSVGLLVLVICYLVTKPERAAATMSRHETLMAARILDWRIIAVVCIPLAVLTYTGRGYNSSLIAGPTTGYWTDLASTFLTVLVALAAFGFLLRNGMRWFVLVLIGQSILLAAAGERTPLVIDAIQLIILLSQAGLRPTHRQLAATLALTIVAILGITGYRAVSGRSIYYSDSGLKQRVLAVGRGLYGVVHTSNVNDTHPGLVAQAAGRLDGNAFAGGILQSMHFGHPALGAAPAGESVLLIVPREIWSSKLTHSAGLNPALTELQDFGLQRINFLPTLLGLYFGFLGPYELIALLAVLGILGGWGERWLFRQASTVRLVVLASSIQAALAYEKGLPGMLAELRAAVVLAIAVKLIELARRRTATLPRRERAHHAGAAVLPGTLPETLSGNLSGQLDADRSRVP
jgi:hypothetical protein